MQVPYLDRPLCEPVQLRPGAKLRIRRVSEASDAAANAPFPHYHDVCELVLFGRVRGSFVADGVRYPLTRGCIAFIPSLQQHDFALHSGARDWMLVQISAGAVAATAAMPGGGRLCSAFCAKPAGQQVARIAMLAEWLADAGENAAIAPTLAHLLLQATAEAPPVQGTAEGSRGDALRRLRPAIERLRRDPAHAPTAEQAALLCALSTAYFSRRFQRQLGMSWSEYVRTHRLHLASQLLLESTRSAAAISRELGFATPSHFGEQFLQRFGMSPSVYRRSGKAGTRSP